MTTSLHSWFLILQGFLIVLPFVFLVAALIAVQRKISAWALIIAGITVITLCSPLDDKALGGVIGLTASIFVADQLIRDLIDQGVKDWRRRPTDRMDAIRDDYSRPLRRKGLLGLLREWFWD